MSKEQFFHALANFEAGFAPFAQQEQQILQEKRALEQALQNAMHTKLGKSNALSTLADELKTTLEKSLQHWDNNLELSLPMQALSQTYSDRVILLVFGKVNAGKSSFCNFLTEQFASAEIKRFRFIQGEVVYFEGEFVENVTEATAEIQGVELGKNLVLLDSPGLHSITDANGALTRQFTDSADGILWLTSSSSPGQVQELADLKLELKKNKPLLPIITKSDIFDEVDICEQTGESIGEWQNKSAEVRREQEKDVSQRLKQSGEVSELKTPLSISIKCCKEDNNLEQAGLNRLFDELISIIEKAKHYKVGKAKQQMLNFIDATVLASLEQDIQPKVLTLIDSADNTILQLEQKKKSLAAFITTNVSLALPSILEKYQATENKQGIVDELNQEIETELNLVLKQELADYVSEIERTSAALGIDAIGNFEDITVDIRQVKGNVAKNITSGAGGLGGAYGGAVLGSMIFPGVGTAIGSILGSLFGGYAGSKVGDSFVETEVIKEKIGVSSEAMQQSITKALQKTLPKAVEQVIDAIIESIHSIQAMTAMVEQAIVEFATRIEKIKGE